MKSYVRLASKKIEPIYIPRRNDGEIDVSPVDAFAGQTFNINEFGHIKSDVQALMECSTKSEQDLIASRLVEAQGSDPDLSGLTDSDIFKFSMSRYYQTPAEVQSFSEALTRASVARSERLAKEASDKAAFEAEQQRIAKFNANVAKAVKNGAIDENGNVVLPKSE